VDQRWYVVLGGGLFARRIDGVVVVGIGSCVLHTPAWFASRLQPELLAQLLAPSLRPCSVRVLLAAGETAAKRSPFVSHRPERLAGRGYSTGFLRQLLLLPDPTTTAIPWQVEAVKMMSSISSSSSENKMFSDGLGTASMDCSSPAAACVGA
jgi:hypothetical protein